MTDKLSRLRLAFAPEHEDLLTGLLFLHAAWGWQDDGTEDGLRRLTVHFDRPEQSAGLQAALHQACPGLRMDADTVDNTDWTSAWKKYFTPIPIGSRFVVLPAWMADTPQQAESILIEPKMAFGTGHHQTTSLCLHGLVRLADEGRVRPGQTFLDLGTGSGILGIAASRLGLSGLGLDIDPVAIDNARENAAINRVEGQLALETGDIGAASGRRFDLILANILANPLMDMAAAVTACLARPGVLMLSGILRDQADGVAGAYTALGLPEPEVAFDQDWALLVFRA